MSDSSLSGPAQADFFHLLGTFYEVPNTGFTLFFGFYFFLVSFFNPNAVFSLFHFPGFSQKNRFLKNIFSPIFLTWILDLKNASKCIMFNPKRTSKISFRFQFFFGRGCKIRFSKYLINSCSFSPEILNSIF
mgnify:CR=1 FL=1